MPLNRFLQPTHIRWAVRISEFPLENCISRIGLIKEAIAHDAHILMVAGSNPRTQHHFFAVLAYTVKCYTVLFQKPYLFRIYGTPTVYAFWV